MHLSTFLDTLIVNILMVNYMRMVPSQFRSIANQIKLYSISVSILLGIYYFNDGQILYKHLRYFSQSRDQ